MSVKEPYLDDEEREIIEAYERGEFLPVENEDLLKKELMQAAKNYLRKSARINIRLSEADLAMLKRKAAEEGLPYQTLIASVLHKFVTKRLVYKTEDGATA
jgi:predicted DNA binding CopG/RHH family protein